MFKTSYTSSLLLLAAFLGIVVICTSSLVSKWRFGQSLDGCEWLHSSVVLNKDVCCKFPFILASLKTYVTHNLA